MSCNLEKVKFIFNDILNVYIIEHFNSYGGVKPLQIEHEGINDIFIHKGSVVHYYNNKWIKLTGAD